MGAEALKVACRPPVCTGPACSLRVPLISCGGCSHTEGGQTPLLPLLQPPESIAFRLSSLPIGCPVYLL